MEGLSEKMGKFCDACERVVPQSEVSTQMTSAGEGSFCERCRCDRCNYLGGCTEHPKEIAHDS